MSWAAGRVKRRGWRSRGGAWVRGSRWASEESLQSLPLGLVGLVTRVVLMGQYVVRSKVGGGDVRSSTALNQILRNAAQSAASDEIVKREFHSGGSPAET